MKLAKLLGTLTGIFIVGCFIAILCVMLSVPGFIAGWIMFVFCFAASFILVATAYRLHIHMKFHEGCVNPLECTKRS